MLIFVMGVVYIVDQLGNISCSNTEILAGSSFHPLKFTLAEILTLETSQLFCHGTFSSISGSLVVFTQRVMVVASLSQPLGGEGV